MVSSVLWITFLILLPLCLSQPFNIQTSGIISPQNSYDTNRLRPPLQTGYQPRGGSQTRGYQPSPMGLYPSQNMQSPQTQNRQANTVRSMPEDIGPDFTNLKTNPVFSGQAATSVIPKAEQVSKDQLAVLHQLIPELKNLKPPSSNRPYLQKEEDPLEVAGLPSNNNFYGPGMNTGGSTKSKSSMGSYGKIGPGIGSEVDNSEFDGWDINFSGFDGTDGYPLGPLNQGDSTLGVGTGEGFGYGYPPLGAGMGTPLGQDSGTKGPSTGNQGNPYSWRYNIGDRSNPQISNLPQLPQLTTTPTGFTNPLLSSNTLPSRLTESNSLNMPSFGSVERINEGVVPSNFGSPSTRSFQFTPLPPVGTSSSSSPQFGKSNINQVNSDMNNNYNVGS